MSCTASRRRPLIARVPVEAACWHFGRTPIHASDRRYFLFRRTSSSPIRCDHRNPEREGAEIRKHQVPSAGRSLLPLRREGVGALLRVEWCRRQIYTRQTRLDLAESYSNL